MKREKKEGKHTASVRSSDALRDHSGYSRQSPLAHLTREAKEEGCPTQGRRSPTIAIRIAGFYPCTPRGIAMSTNLLGITGKAVQTVFGCRRSTEYVVLQRVHPSCGGGLVEAEYETFWVDQRLVLIHAEMCVRILVAMRRFMAVLPNYAWSPAVTARVLWKCDSAERGGSGLCGEESNLCKCPKFAHPSISLRASPYFFGVKSSAIFTF